MQHLREPAKAFSAASANEMLADLSMDTQSGAQDTETPTDDEPLELEKLSRISCQFGAGSNTGLVWEGRTTVGTAEWQGGPIIFDSIDLTAGTAQMLGNVGAIGSAEGQVASRVIARGGRLEFLSALKTGPLVLTTIYGNLDEQGGYVATMSRHEGGAHSYASQFLGSCK